MAGEQPGEEQDVGHTPGGVWDAVWLLVCAFGGAGLGGGARSKNGEEQGKRAAAVC